MIQPQHLTEFLDQFFQIDRYSSDVGGIYHNSDRTIHRLGLALEPFPDLNSWIEKHRIDAVFLHRPWSLQPDAIPPEIGIIFYHLAFDERMTLGFNLRLAEALSLTQVEPFGEKENRAIGMIGAVPARSLDRYAGQVREVFGAYDSIVHQAETVSRVAVVGAMNDTLIRAAADRGVTVYITGQFREAAKAAVLETEISVIEVGHRRCERWGLRSLAAVLRERWSKLQVLIGP